MIISIDFDGTICEDKHPEVGKILPDAARVINRISSEHTVIINTCRHTEKDLKEMINFLDFYRITVHHINNNVFDLIQKYGDCRKIYADIYIDDHNLGGFTGWKDVEEILEEIGWLTPEENETDNLFDLLEEEGEDEEA